MAEENEKRDRVALWGIMFGFFKGGREGGGSGVEQNQLFALNLRIFTLQNYFEPHRNLH